MMDDFVAHVKQGYMGEPPEASEQWINSVLEEWNYINHTHIVNQLTGQSQIILITRQKSYGEKAPK